jgi:hypothetical protein
LTTIVLPLQWGSCSAALTAFTMKPPLSHNTTTLKSEWDGQEVCVPRSAHGLYRRTLHPGLGYGARFQLRFCTRECYRITRLRLLA